VSAPERCAVRYARSRLAALRRRSSGVRSSGCWRWLIDVIDGGAFEQEPSVVIRTRQPVDRRRTMPSLNWSNFRPPIYAAWLEALPDTLRGTATAEALQAIVDVDLDTLAAIEPPRGYGMPAGLRASLSSAVSSAIATSDAARSG
jgi:hypothetical protein